MTDDREISVRTVTCFVPMAVVTVVVVFSALKRCAYAPAQIAELRQQNEPAPRSTATRRRRAHAES